MSEPIIQANESLVLNGDFEESCSHWKAGPVNSNWLGTTTEEYEGEWISFLKAGNKSSVSQALKIPVDPGAQARYVLSFLCEMRHIEAGKLVVSIDGQSETLEISLQPGKPPDPEEDQARLKNGQPLKFQPIKYEVDLNLPFHAQDTITVSVFSPPNELGDYASQVRITRIKISLHLGPMEMRGLTLDEEALPRRGPLYLCLGASASNAHRLGFVLEPDNVWVGTPAALISDDNPQGAILATPDWGVNHQLDSFWSLDCPYIGDQEPYLFEMNLVNKYNADPYPIAVSLGHHRLVFREVLEAAYYPVLEYGQTVRLGVRVASWYTGYPVDGRTVNWTVEAQGVKGAAVTDDNGWAYFDYVPTAQGTFSVKASVDSLYYAAGVVVSETLEVRVLATDPWKEVLAVSEGNETRWEEKTGYPNRGSTYPVNVKLPVDSPLLGTDVWLRWNGDSPEQLGVTVSPVLEAPVPVNEPDAVWTLTNDDDLDGRFELSLVCSKLLLPSPKKLMSLARNVVRIGDVREANKFAVVDESESVLLRVQVVHHVINGDGDPVTNALVDWTTPEGIVSTTTGAGGWANVLYTPQNEGDTVITANVRAHEDAVAMEQPFNVKALATSPWKGEVRILLDNVEVDRVALGLLCWRGQSHTLKVEPLTGSSLINENMTLNWRSAPPAIGLVPSDIGTPRSLPVGGLEWTLDSEANTSLSGLFELKLTSEALSVDRELFGRLISPDLTQEVALVLDQIPSALGNQTLYPCLGALHRFIVLPNALSPLVGLSAMLLWSGTPAEQLGAKVEPALDQRQAIGDGGARWALDFNASPAPGQFALALALPQLDFVATANPMALAHNKVRIEAWRESAVDPVVGQEPAWMWVQVLSHFTERAVDQVPVTWVASESPSVVKTEADGWSGFAFAPAAGNPEHQVAALVTSPYDGYQEQRVMTVTALASDPWEGLRVSFDKQPFQPWGEKTYFPRRKGEHSVDLEAASNSPLFGHPLMLGMTGTGPAELGIRFLSEGLGVPRSFYDTGLQYLFNVGDLKDGSFALRLSSERLASLSPANAMSLGEGAQVLKIIGNSSVYQTLDWGQELVEQVAVISGISGRPMAGVTVTWRSPELGEKVGVTDFYGVAKVSFKPTVPGVTPLTATAGDAIHSESIALPFTLNEPREIQSLVCAEPVGYPGDTVSAMATIVSARTGGPLSAVEVMWEYAGVKLTPTMSGPDGVASVSFKLSTVGENLLVATVKGGRGGWDMASVVIEVLPVHARIKEVTASPNPAFTGTYISMTAVIVSTASAEPLPDREVFVSVNGAPYLPAKTDARGEIKRYWRPLDVEPVSLYVEVRNPGEAPQRWGVDVVIKG
ncbi:hypothetical protein [Pseudomonas sp. ANT_J28]|uniref:hypothetical protein n=1 Tax=Pseudomonas sp. ANT_J28 TaxID=2597352 RepID=UPI0011F386F5|nr:hypothetical protein [Pseudomonas sp. ANT_J28]KAA0986048.1 hypothetical protein FQ187_03455 [Pseudomonas sp. ANT_J28]